MHRHIGSRSSLSTDDNLTNWLYVEYRISFEILFNLIKMQKIVGYFSTMSATLFFLHYVGRPAADSTFMRPVRGYDMFGLV